MEANVRTVSPAECGGRARTCPAGHRLSEQDLTVMRPGTGIPRKRAKKVLQGKFLHPPPSEQATCYVSTTYNKKARSAPPE